MDGLSIVGAWTQAGFASCIHLKGKDSSENILLDCGVCESQTLGAEFVFITHSHIDHIGATISHARGKTLSKKYAKYYVPVDAVQALLQAKDAFEKLDGREIVMEVIPFSIGQRVDISKSLSVEAFPTIHRVPSQGYVFRRKTKGKMRMEFRGLSGLELKRLRETGVALMHPDVEHVELVYTGDTVFEALLKPSNTFVFTAATLIMELTYLDGDTAKAREHSHIHVNDIVANATRFQNENIVFCHLSPKYSPHSRATNILRNTLPPILLQRAYVCARSFGSGRDVTYLGGETASWTEKKRAVGWGWGTRKAVNVSTNILSVSTESSRMSASALRKMPRSTGCAQEDDDFDDGQVSEGEVEDTDFQSLRQSSSSRYVTATTPSTTSVWRGPKLKRVCKFYLHGDCNAGDDCRFMHENDTKWSDMS